MLAFGRGLSQKEAARRTRGRAGTAALADMKKSLGARTVAYPTPVFVVGTYDVEGQPNLMTVSWAGICCSVPPCVSISLRRATYTYAT